MPDDLRQALKAAARGPATVPDVEGTWRRMRRRRHLLRFGGVALVLGLAVSAGPGLLERLGPDVHPVVTAVEVDRAPETVTSAGQTWRQWRIDGYGVEFPVPSDWHKQGDDPTTWKGGDGSLTVFVGSAPYGDTVVASLEAHCRAEAAHRPGLLPRPVIRVVTAAEGPACLVTAPERGAFVAVVAFPDLPMVAGRSSHLILVGDGLDPRVLLDGLRFAE